MSSHFTSAIQCLSLLARFHQVPAEPSALLREFLPDASSENAEALADINLIRAAKSLGFKAKFIQDKPEKLSEHLLPAIARHKDGHFFIIVKVANDEVLVQDIDASATSNAPTSHSFVELNDFWAGELLLLSKRTSFFSGVMTQSAKFGFSWFIPALIKYKPYFSDVFSVIFYSIGRASVANILSSGN